MCIDIPITYIYLGTYLKYIPFFSIFLQILSNERALRSELESMEVTFKHKFDTKASELQTLEVSNN